MAVLLIAFVTSNIALRILCSVDAHSCIISQINPTSCTILFNIFICFSSVHVSGIHVPIIRRKLLYPCHNGTCHSVWVASGLLVGLKSNQQTRRHPYRVTSTNVSRIQQFYPDDGHMDARNM